MASTSLEKFDALFPELVNALTMHDRDHPEPTETLEWFKELLEYNVPHGKKNRGISVVTSYCRLVENPTEEELKMARIVGWCVELFQSYLLVLDDIMDQSETRRGLPCWYQKEGVGVSVAINDGLLLESAVYKILKTYVRGQPYYVDVMELFRETGYQTTIGQSLDLMTAPSEGTIDFSEFTADKHAAIVKWKTAFYTLYLPIALAMYMAGIRDNKNHKNAKTILLKMGHYFQVQDDFLDCYGDPSVIGKIGTDIQDNKCSWLIVHALEAASDQQIQVLKDNYGRWDDSCVQKVKDVYEELNLQGLYRRFEDKIYYELVTLTNTLAGDLPKGIFMDYANRLYKRNK